MHCMNIVLLFKKVRKNMSKPKSVENVNCRQEVYQHFYKSNMANSLTVNSKYVKHGRNTAVVLLCVSFRSFFCTRHEDVIISLEFPPDRSSFHILLVVTMSGYFLSRTPFCHKLKSITIPLRWRMNEQDSEGWTSLKILVKTFLQL